MTKSGSLQAGPARLLSRRSLLIVPGLSVLAVASCGDESNDRHFAGDPRTAPAGSTLPPQLTSVAQAGSPTAAPTAMETLDLISPRGSGTIGLIPLRHELIVVHANPAEGRSIWSNDDRALWSAVADPTSTIVAALTSDDNSATGWTVEFIPVEGGDIVTVPVGAASGKEHAPDAVAEGRGGLAWLPDSGSVVVSLPSGGLLQVFPDGSQVKLAKAAIAKRPQAVALAQDGGAIAFVEQPTGSDGSGIYAGSMRAKPIDPIVVLPPDRSGNRYARDVQWIGESDRLATILEREELGSPQGDLFFLDVHNPTPQLAWTSPPGRDPASVESFSISPDGLVTAFVTNPARSGVGKTSSVWVMQTDGPSIERFDLPMKIADPRIVFSSDGLIVTGLTGRIDDEDGLPAGFLLAPNGKIELIYQQAPGATPVASPSGSPIASPVASPVASPASPSPQPVTSGE